MSLTFKYVQSTEKLLFHFILLFLFYEILSFFATLIIKFILEAMGSTQKLTTKQ